MAGTAGVDSSGTIGNPGEDGLGSGVVESDEICKIYTKIYKF